ncbi:MAG TPA: methyltransferase [Microbacterium sp.]|nr:methyltransferase [Microbacterium sp.]
MPPFPYHRLRRWPDVEAPDLQAWDATDVLLVDRAVALAASQAIDGTQIAVIGDGYGAITLALTDAGYAGVRVHQDLATGRRALARNAEELALDGCRPHELDEALLAGARLVLLQLPKSLAELQEIADAVARWAADDVVVVAGGRVKHMTLGQNDVLGRSFAHVQAERAERKSRLIVASGPRPVPPEPPFPVSMQHDRFTLVAHGGVFAGARIDIGTRVLLDVLGLGGSQLLENDADEGESARNRADDADSGGVVNSDLVVDLGCGNGALAVAYALAHPDAHVVATDRSAAAVASARAAVAANGLSDRIVVTHDDAGSELADGSAGTVLLNPPFHLGTSIHTAAATRLFEAAARLLRPGGELWTVYNSSLAYKSTLTRTVGPTEQVHRTPKFTVTRSIRR